MSWLRSVLQIVLLRYISSELIPYYIGDAVIYVNPQNLGVGLPILHLLRKDLAKRKTESSKEIVNKVPDGSPDTRGDFVTTNNNLLNITVLPSNPPQSNISEFNQSIFIIESDNNGSDSMKTEIVTESTSEYDIASTQVTEAQLESTIAYDESESFESYSDAFNDKINLTTISYNSDTKTVSMETANIDQNLYYNPPNSSVPTAESSNENYSQEPITEYFTAPTTEYINNPPLPMENKLFPSVLESEKSNFTEADMFVSPSIVTTNSTLGMEDINFLTEPTTTNSNSAISSGNRLVNTVAQNTSTGQPDDTDLTYETPTDSMLLQKNDTVYTTEPITKLIDDNPLLSMENEKVYVNSGNQELSYVQDSHYPSLTTEHTNCTDPTQPPETTTEISMQINTHNEQKYETFEPLQEIKNFYKTELPFPVIPAIHSTSTQSHRSPTNIVKENEFSNHSEVTTEDSMTDNVETNSIAINPAEKTPTNTSVHSVNETCVSDCQMEDLEIPQSTYLVSDNLGNGTQISPPDKNFYPSNEQTNTENINNEGLNESQYHEGSSNESGNLITPETSESTSLLDDMFHLFTNDPVNVKPSIKTSEKLSGEPVKNSHQTFPEKSNHLNDKHFLEEILHKLRLSLLNNKYRKINPVPYSAMPTRPYSYPQFPFVRPTPLAAPYRFPSHSTHSPVRGINRLNFPFGSVDQKYITHPNGVPHIFQNFRMNRPGLRRHHQLIPRKVMRNGLPEPRSRSSTFRTGRSKRSTEGDLLMKKLGRNSFSVVRKQLPMIVTSYYTYLPVPVKFNNIGNSLQNFNSESTREDQTIIYEDEFRNERASNVCQCGVRVAKRIVGGTTTVISEFPWMAQLIQRSNDKVYCGGTVINDRYILTAAHCTEEFEPSAMYIRLGATNVTSTQGKEYEVETFITHPRYVDVKRFEIALIKLSCTIKFSSTIIPICLPSPFLRNTLDGIITGWGHTKETGAFSPVLRKATVQISRRNECLANSNYVAADIHRSVLCAAAPNTDACQGDSGGPLMVERSNAFQLGISSWGIGCARPDFPGVYTRVQSYLNWIYRNTRDANYCSTTGNILFPTRENVQELPLEQLEEMLS